MNIYMNNITMWIGYVYVASIIRRDPALVLLIP